MGKLWKVEERRELRERTRWKEKNLEIMPWNEQLSVRNSKSSHDHIFGHDGKMRREKKLLLNGCKAHNTCICYLCVTAGNSLFAVVLKLGQKNLFEINNKKIILIHRKNSKRLDLVWENNNDGRGREISVTEALM